MINSLLYVNEILIFRTRKHKLIFKTKLIINFETLLSITMLNYLLFFAYTHVNSGGTSNVPNYMYTNKHKSISN